MSLEDDASSDPSLFLAIQITLLECPFRVPFSWP
eukprot:CAMPEP_0174934488 /NCGR_PEP_ID=MMETSP1355-20121228/49760_1 /TAXON_ID=464990 /ORGANISM="Hemiselmis tepida, Strain CCMP443" /LENGTH=33 /DNA_ID= /DNA_START= /DNA_END= /DNA_ORIENTATION=